MKLSWRALVALGSWTLITGTPSAGPVGDCEIKGGAVELKVLFLYDETDLDGWKPVFEEASRLMFNATEGNLYIGEVKFFVACQPVKDQADIWISQGTGGASAHVGGCGMPGWHVFLSNIHKRNDASAHGQLGMVHELGHYIFSLRDEYGGCISDPTTGAKVSPPSGKYQWGNSDVSVSGGGKAFFCTVSSGGTACIMDAGTTITSAFNRTEWCSPGTHVGPRNLTVTVPLAGIVNASMTIENNQQCEVTGNCWSSVASVLGLSVIPDPPSTTPPAGATTPKFSDIGAAARFVLCLDSSGSMSGARIDLAKAGARLFAGNSRLPRMEFNRQVPGDELGVVAFSSVASTVYSLRELMTAADISAVQGAINGINASGSTSIGGGLRSSLNQLTGRGTPGCIEAIVLLSDGFHNTGEAPASVVPDIVSRGAVVFSIAVGTGADNALLQSISGATGGKFFIAASPADLPTIFAEIQATVTGAPILERVKRNLEEGESEDVAIHSDSGIGKLSVSLTDPGFESTLISPSGVASNPSAQAVGVTYSTDGTVEVYEVASPETGNWIVRLSRTGTGSGDFNLLATAPVSRLDGTHLQAMAPDALNLMGQPGAGIPIQVALSEGPGIIGAVVAAEVTRPDGSVVTVSMLDDGQAASGDGSFGDGVYSAVFREFAGDGAYSFNVRADTSGAFLVTGEDGPPSAPVQATSAVRSTSVTTTVAGAPTFVAVVVEFGPETLNLKSNGRYVTAYVETPAGLDPAEIDVTTLAITAIDGQGIAPIYAELSPTEIGDFDEDGTPDLMVKFSRSALRAALTSGDRLIRVEGDLMPVTSSAAPSGAIASVRRPPSAAGRAVLGVLGERSIRVIDPGK